MARDYDQIRFQGESELVRILEEDYALASYYDIFDNKDELENITTHMLSNTIKLSPVIAPRLYKLCSELQGKLDFQEAIDFYLYSTAEVNAFSINGFGIVPHIICFTSELIRQLDDDELRFVIGHEIGHLIFKHSQLDVVNKILANRENEEIPAAIAIHFLRWQRYAEISSDRIGFLAMPDIKLIGKVFFKFASGLSEQYLNFDIDEYLKQLDKIKEIATGDFYTTHPNNLVRIQALLDFSNSVLLPGEKAAEVLDENALNSRIIDLMNLLEVHPKKDKDKKVIEFLSVVGTYIAAAENEVSERVWKELYEWISQYTTQPESYLKFENLQDVEQRTKAICAYYTAQNDMSKYELFEMIVYLALIDGRLEQAEKARLYELGEALAISRDAITLTIRRSSETNLSPSRKSATQNLL